MKYPDRNADAPTLNPADRWRCRDIDQHGDRCARPGTLGESTSGHGGRDGNDDPHVYCAMHFPPMPNVKTIEPTPIGLGPHVAKLAEDNRAWARRIMASRPDYRLSCGIEFAREALGIEPDPPRIPGQDG